MQKEELESVFADALSEVVSIVSGFSLDGSPSDNDAEFDGMIGAMSLNGAKKNGMIFISADENSVKTLSSYMTGIAQEEITKEDLFDALCELVNMTAGNAKLRIGDPDYMFNLSWPFAINGENMSIITKTRVNVLSKVLVGVDISLKLKVVY